MNPGRFAVAPALAVLALVVLPIGGFAQPERVAPARRPVAPSDLDRGGGMALGIVTGAIAGIVLCDRAQGLSCPFVVGAAITLGGVLGAAAAGDDDSCVACDRELPSRTWSCVDPAVASGREAGAPIRPRDGRPVRDRRAGVHRTGVTASTPDGF